jgi:copper chaperone CopZ
MTAIGHPVTATYSVPGIGCQQCVDALEYEIGQITGVRDVSVDVARSATRHPCGLSVASGASAGTQVNH